jgi:hypothetical protein
VVELKLSLLGANRVETACPGSWALSVDGERVLGGPADGPVDGLEIVMQRLVQELRDQIDEDRLDDAVVAQVLRRALASNAAVLVAVGAWPPHQHQGKLRTGDDDS